VFIVVPIVPDSANDTEGNITEEIAADPMEDIKPRLLLLLSELHVDSFSISFPFVVSLRNVVDGCATTGFCIGTKPETIVEVSIKIAEQSDDLTVLHIAITFVNSIYGFIYEEDGRWTM
jgi:hypothetical protein